MRRTGSAARTEVTNFCVVFLMQSDRHRKITADEIDCLPAQTFLGSADHHAQLDSTNSRAALLAAGRDPATLPHLVYAEQQTAGRGRQGKGWFSAPGSLTFSVIVSREAFGLSREQLPLAALATGIAVLQAGLHFLPQGDFGLKWPNDVFLAGRKVAGILLEVPQPGDTVVIGIGVNVNNDFDGCSAADVQQSISLHDIAEAPLDRLTFLTRLLGQLEVQLAHVAAGQNIARAWNRYCLLSERTVTLELADRQLQGRCRGIDASGRLLLDEAGSTTAFATGEVRSWR